MTHLSPLDLCELMDLIENNASAWTHEDIETNGQLWPIYEHMRLTCNVG